MKTYKERTQELSDAQLAVDKIVAELEPRVKEIAERIENSRKPYHNIPNFSSSLKYSGHIYDGCYDSFGICADTVTVKSTMWWGGTEEEFYMEFPVEYLDMQDEELDAAIEVTVQAELNKAKEKTLEKNLHDVKVAEAKLKQLQEALEKTK